METFIIDVKRVGKKVDNYLKKCIKRVKREKKLDFEPKTFDFETRPFAIFTELGIALIITETVKTSIDELREYGYEFSFDVEELEEFEAELKVFVTKIDLGL